MTHLLAAGERTVRITAGAVHLQLRQGGSTTKAAAVRGERIAETILDYARKHDVDLIALATRQRGPRARAVFGSVADSIIRRAEVPVLVFHRTEPHPATDLGRAL